MEVLIAIMCSIPVGVALGIFLEHRYGNKLSADNAAAHAALNTATQAVQQAAATVASAVKPSA